MYIDCGVVTKLSVVYYAKALYHLILLNTITSISAYNVKSWMHNCEGVATYQSFFKNISDSVIMIILMREIKNNVILST